MIWCIKTYIIAYVKIQKNEDILSIMSNLQPNCCLKVDFKKVDQHAGGKWLIHDTKRRKDNQLKAWNSPAKYKSWGARCDIKGSDLEYDMLKDCPEAKASWEVRDCKTTNTNYQSVVLKEIPKVTSILVLDHVSESKTQLVNQRKQKVAFWWWFSKIAMKHNCE